MREMRGGRESIEDYPRMYVLHQNYPNPFNPSTTIAYEIPSDVGEVDVHLTIYDMRGRLVRQLVEGERHPGRYEAQWDGRNDRGVEVESGVYFFRLTAGNYLSTRKLVVMK